ncbi:MAG: hypothetical protein AAFQ04_01675 [Pseudomonadota bacterium]
MYPVSSNRGSGLQSAFGPVATIASLCLSVFIAPKVYPALEPRVWQALIGQYDHHTASWLAWVIKIASYPATYVILRLAIMAGFMSLSTWAVRRLM